MSVARSYSAKIPQKASLVLQVAHQLLDRLASGKYAVGDALPTQSEWAKQFEVSSFTVSRAFSLLKARGVVSAAQGSYTRLLKIPSRMLLHEEETPPVELELWEAKANDPQKIPGILMRRRFMREFMEAHPHIRLHTRLIDNGSLSTTEAELIQSMLNGPSPAVANMEYTSLNALVGEKAIAPLHASIRANLIQRVEAIVVERCSSDGQTYLYPIRRTCSMLCIHRDAARKFQIGDRTHAQPLPEWCDRLVHASKTRPALHVHRGYGLAYFFFHLLYACAPESSRPSLPGLQWTEDFVLQAVDLFLRVINENAMGLVEDGPETHARFLRGEFPILFAPPDMLVQAADTQYQAEQLRLLPIPRIEGSPAFSLSNVGGLVVNGRLTAIEQEAAWRYIEAYAKWLWQTQSPASLFGVQRSSGKNVPRGTSLPDALREDITRIANCAVWEPPGTHWLCQSLTPVLEQALNRIPRPITRDNLLNWIFVALRQSSSFGP
jgi:DNA-binding transcriptional regulator YhcF (GntR family)